MNTIVVPVDYTPLSLNAANYAADMACALDCSLSLLHVYPVPVVIDDMQMTVYTPTETESFEKERIEKLKRDICDRTGNTIQVYTRIMLDEIMPAIENYCTYANPYAVVMGSESADKISRLLGIAPTLRARKLLNWPLIVVPGTATFASVKKIGLACDLTDVAKTIPGDRIIKMVKGLGAELHILHISESSGEIFKPEIMEGSDQLQQMFFELKPKYHETINKNVEEGIEEFVEAVDPDMLIVIPKKHTALQRLLTKSITKQLVLHLQLPVVVMH